MTQVNSVNRISETTDPKPVVQPPSNNKETTANPVIEQDKIDIPLKENNYDQPFGRDKDKPVVKTTKTKGEIVEDEWEDVPKVELIPPTPWIDVDMNAINGFDPKNPPYIDIDVSDFNNYEQYNKPSFTPGNFNTDTGIGLIFTPVPKNLNSLVTTTYSDIRGNKIQVKGNVVQPLNSLMAITNKKNIKVGITYSYRSTEQQKMLWDKAIKRYGSAASARKWVAPPGRSHHNKGIALDISMFKDGKKIPQSQFDNIIAKAGFYRPMSWEGWHIEPVATRTIG